jgi:PAS domain S-box-containing protein
MGLLSSVIIALSGITLFVCCIQILLGLRKGRDRLLLLGATSSFAFVIYLIVFTILIGRSDHPAFILPSYKIVQATLLLVLISFASLIFFITGEKKKIIALPGMIILFLLFILSLVLPVDILFGEEKGLYVMISFTGERFLMPALGFTLGRIMTDLAIAVYFILSSVLLIRNLDKFDNKFLILITCSLFIVALCAIFDHLVDLGMVNYFYILPLGLTFNYMTVALLPVSELVIDVFRKLNQLDQDKKLRTLINQANLIVVVLDRMGHVDFINPYFLQLSGYRENEVLGKDWFEFFVPQEQHYEVQSAFIEILEYDFHPYFRNPIITKYHDKRQIDWYNVRLRGADGQVTGSISVGVDVTDELLECDELKRKLSEAEALIEQLRKF